MGQLGQWRKRAPEQHQVHDQQQRQPGDQHDRLPERHGVTDRDGRDRQCYNRRDEHGRVDEKDPRNQ